MIIGSGHTLHLMFLGNRVELKIPHLNARTGCLGGWACRAVSAQGDVTTTSPPCATKSWNVE
jgi:hypothetical protein